MRRYAKRWCVMPVAAVVTTHWWSLLSLRSLRRSLIVLAAFSTFSGMSILAPGVARADDWGCQVMLCLSNPGGPEQYAECVPPIERLWAALRHGDPFPVCDLSADGALGTSAGRRSRTSFPPPGIAGRVCCTGAAPKKASCCAICTRRNPCRDRRRTAHPCGVGRERNRPHAHGVLRCVGGNKGSPRHHAPPLRIPTHCTPGGDGRRQA
jgi:hypothetical protein